MRATVNFVSSEWIVSLLPPNGGAVIALRSLTTSAFLLLLYLGLRNGLDPGRTWEPSLSDLRRQLIEHLTLWASMFAATYAAFYARFAAQWTYLANVYNQIKAAECRGECKAEVLADWKAGFIEDAIELHLARKPLFGSVIYAWSEEEAVRTSVHQHASPNCRQRFVALLAELKSQRDPI